MPKEKSITELRDERNQLATRSKEITAGARRETRMLNEGEQKELGEIQCRLADINTEIAMHEEENRGKGKLHQLRSVTWRPVLLRPPRLCTIRPVRKCLKSAASWFL